MYLEFSVLYDLLYSHASSLVRLRIISYSISLSAEYSEYYNVDTVYIPLVSIFYVILSFNGYDLKSLKTVFKTPIFCYNSDLGYVSDERALYLYKTAGLRTNEWGFPI